MPEPISCQLPILSLGSKKDKVDSDDLLSVTHSILVMCGSVVGELHIALF